MPNADEPSACSWKAQATKAWFFVSGLEPGSEVRVGTSDAFITGTVSSDGTFGGEEHVDGRRAEPAIDAGRPVSTYTMRGTARSGNWVVLPLDQ